MPSQDPYAHYAEALTALSSVDNLHREALRRAIEGASTAEAAASTSMAAQQRIYARATKDADDADRLLGELRATLGAPTVPSNASRPAGTPPSLADIRGVINEVARWAADNRPVAESLLRTRARLAQSPSGRPAAAAAPATRRRSRLVAAGAAAAVLMVAVIAVVVLTR